MDWGKLPFGGSWHFWQTGRDMYELIPKIRKPYAQWDIYITGDQYALTSSWIDGAINNVEKMLQTEYELARASWIPADYDMGP
jgi:alpha-L-fucosidase